jgi:hypothetical protein
MMTMMMMTIVLVMKETPSARSSYCVTSYLIETWFLYHAVCRLNEGVVAGNDSCLYMYAERMQSLWRASIQEAVMTADLPWNTYRLLKDKKLYLS